jgi:hypothetical protein
MSWLDMNGRNKDEHGKEIINLTIIHRATEDC